MRCRIAELITELPAAGGMTSRCKDYLWEGEGEADIVICDDQYRPELFPSWFSEDQVAYMESAGQFYYRLIRFDGFFLHASAVVVDGRAYLFSGHPGAGKSTHSRLWLQLFGEDAVIINDDKPALRRIDGVWYAYGTPWCGKDGINTNDKAPLAGVCFMKKARHNRIRPMSTFEAMHRIMGQTTYKFRDVELMDRMLGLLDQFLQEIPVFELENLPDLSAARLSFETMSGRGQEDNK